MACSSAGAAAGTVADGNGKVAEPTARGPIHCACAVSHSFCSLSPHSWICNRDDKVIDVFNGERGAEEQ